MYDLAERVAIVTGAAGGIGAAISLALARCGARVIVADIAIEGAERVAASLVAQGFAARPIRVDLADAASIAAMIQDATCFGRYAILVNNAADQSADLVRRDSDVEHTPAAVWDRVFHINLRGTMLCCQKSLSVFRSAGGGAIVNVASNLALQGHVIQCAYSASKAAILQMTRSIATSHGCFNIRCNAVSPGLTISPSASANLPPEILRIVQDETPVGTLGAPEDIAAAVLFAVSDEARYMSGHNLVVDGGTSVHVPGLAPFRAALSAEHAA